MIKKPKNIIRPPLKTSHVTTKVARQLFLVSWCLLVTQRNLYVLIQIFIRIMLRCIWWKKNLFCFYPVSFNPFLHLFSVMYSKIVYYQENLHFHIFDQPFEKNQKYTGFQRAFLNHEPTLSMIGNSRNHAGRKSGSCTIPHRSFSFGRVSSSSIILPRQKVSSSQ